jgi:hypothetical protein
MNQPLKKIQLWLVKGKPMVRKLVMLWNRPWKSPSVVRKPVTFGIGRGSSGEEPVMKKPILHWNRPWKIPL